MTVIRPVSLERFRVPEAQLRTSVAHDDAAAILGQPPALAWIFEFAFAGEAGQIVDEAALRLPGQFQQAVLPVDDAFPEIFLRHIALLQHLAGLQTHLADGRLPFQARCPHTG